MHNSIIAGSLFTAALFSVPVSADPVLFTVGGDNTTASIQGTVDAFREALGDPNNGNQAGPLATGRREINWDGAGSVDTTPIPPVTPFEVFLNTRGGQFTTPGTGLTQAPLQGGIGDGLVGLFGNATYATTFTPFSPVRLFVPVGSNITEANFFLPGTNGTVAATVSGFGAVFTDVDLADTTSLEFFDAGGGLLFSTSVAPGSVADASLSFLGVIFDEGERISSVRITTGNTALGPNANDNPALGVDVVAMDDFFYGEPQAIAIPEPATLSLLALALLAMVGLRRAWSNKRG